MNHHSKQAPNSSRPNQSNSLNIETKTTELSSFKATRAPSQEISLSTRLEAHATLVGIGLALHLLADLDVDIKELGHAAVEADGLALVEVAFAVIGGNTLLGAGLSQAIATETS